MLDSIDSANTILIKNITIKIQLNITKSHVQNLLKSLFAETRGFTFQVNFCKVIFCKDVENDKTMYSPLIYVNSKTQTVINDLDIDNSLVISYQTILP